MKYFKAGVQVLPPISKVNALNRIEEIGRICYKSEDKITNGSAEKFVKSLIKRGHESVLEHATFCIRCGDEGFNGFNRVLNQLEFNHGFRNFLRRTSRTTNLISGNARAWRDFFYACSLFNIGIPSLCGVLVSSEPVLFGEWSSKLECNQNTQSDLIDTSTLVDYVEKMTHHDISVKFICDRGVSHEFVRHRVASISQESTRYCNYSGGLGIIDIYTAFKESDEKKTLLTELQEKVEETYKKLTVLGAKPDEVRSVLPNCTKTELVLTMNGQGWENFIGLRDSVAAHPQARELASVLHDWFRANASYIVED